MSAIKVKVLIEKKQYPNMTWAAHHELGLLKLDVQSNTPLSNGVLKQALKLHEEMVQTFMVPAPATLPSLSIFTSDPLRSLLQSLDRGR